MVIYVINPNKALLYGKSLQNNPTFASILIPQKMVTVNDPGFMTALGVQLRPPKSRKKSAQASFDRPRDQWKLHVTTWSWWFHSGFTDVSENSGFYPQIINFNRVFHYKPSILGYPYFWKHPFTDVSNHRSMFTT